jgi:hypothetical protein
MSYPFERLPNAVEIIHGLNDIPSNWSLTPVWDKSPKRSQWQTEPTLDRGAIAELIFDGESKVSKNGKDYKYFASGYGLRTGDYSGGLIAIDVDGDSALPILEAIAGTKEFSTVSWCSGKPGRFQIVYQIPEDMRSHFKDFKRRVLNSYENFECRKEKDKISGKEKYAEGLEFRYNEVQSVLPPSRHPDTGAYKWLRSPLEYEVAIAPQWLIDILLKIKDEVTTIGDVPDWNQYKKTVAKGLKMHKDLKDFLMYDVYPRLSPEQIFNWSGHNFRQVGKTFKGNPPWRESASGTSFHIWYDGEQWAWQDKQTGEGGGAIAYRHKLNGGIGKPRGKDFVAIVKELARDAGVDMPPYSPDQVTIAETIALKEEEIQEAIANAEILSSVVRDRAEEESEEEKAEMIRSLTAQWENQFKTQVWSLIEQDVRSRIKLLLR